ncbi:MAG: tetratricopeptide repeat protein, partial [Planctomycetes bacterium]|nr:tetratricopeptide repeat protein [Planctomycetota bacterium]
FETGQLAKALVTANQIVGMAPDQPDGHLLVGQIYLEQNRYSLAIKSLKRCLALDSENAQAQYHLGAVYESRKDLSQAYVHYDIASKLEPFQESYLRAVLEIQISRGKIPQAIKRLHGHIELVRNDVSLCLIAGEMYTFLEMHEKAVSMYQWAQSMSSRDVKINESLAYSLLRAGRAREALVLFERLLQENRSEGQQDKKTFFLAIGDCYMQIGDYRLARRSYEKVTQIDRFNPSAWARLAQVALAREDYEQAQGYAQRAQSLQKDYPDALMVFGYIAMEKLQYARARNLFRQVVKTQPHNGTAYCLLGKSLQYNGQASDAEDCYVKALKINPGDKLAQSLLRRLRNTRIGSSPSVEQN